MTLIKAKFQAVIKDTIWVIKDRPEAAGALFLVGYLAGYFVGSI